MLLTIRNRTRCCAYTPLTLHHFSPPNSPLSTESQINPYFILPSHSSLPFPFPQYPSIIHPLLPPHSISISISSPLSAPLLHNPNPNLNLISILPSYSLIAPPPPPRPLCNQSAICTHARTHARKNVGEGDVSCRCTPLSDM
jgi:hypothetical protein